MFNQRGKQHLLELSKSDKRSNQSREFNVPVIEQQVKEKETCQAPLHLINQAEIMETGKRARNKILESGRFKWDEEFKGSMDVQVLQTNFEWMRVMLHYGNYKLEILVIYTEIEERIFEEGDAKRGSFGVVRFLLFEGVKYAVKGIKFSYKDGDIDTVSAYKEYFLGYMAGILQIGPEVLPLFGYDILLTKNMAFFSMEECQPTKVQFSQTVESELLSSMKTMHAINLVHSDIKPDNVAFSLRLGRHVFIDFGLSRLIEQPPGQKTKTKFCGTLSYCSQEMKKCYVFQMAKFVDLYGNDLCCLEKTVKSLAYMLKVKNTFKDRKRPQNEDTIKMSIFQQVTQILRLKYFIQTQNKERILEIILNIKGKKIICEIFSGSDIPKIVSDDKNIKGEYDLIKNLVFKRRCQIDAMDLLLCQLFSQERRVMSAEKIVPISQIILSGPEFFNRYLVKPELILKLFHFFDPLSNNFQAESKCNLKRTIVEKIYELKGNGLKNPVFFYEKVRFALVYFHQKLKHLKNLRVMLSLRLLFLSLQLRKIAEDLQNQIIEMINEPVLKALKIIEFSLFRSFFLWGFRRSNQKWINQIMRLPADHISFQKQTIKLLSIISETRCLPSFQQQLRKHKQSLMNQIKQVSTECPEAFEKQSIRNIKYFYVQLCQIQGPTPSQQGFKLIQMKIYSRCWDYNSIQYATFEEQQIKLFWPLKFELQNCIRTNNSKNSLKNLTLNQFQALKDRDEPFKSFIFHVLLLNYYIKAHLKFFIQKIRKLVQEKQNRLARNYQGTISDFDVEEIIACVNLFMELVLRNQTLAEEEERIDRESKIMLIDELQAVFNQFIDGQAVKSAINSSFHLKIDTMITKVKFQLKKGQNQDIIRSSIQNIVTLLDPFPCHHPELISNFFTLYEYFHPQPHPQLQPHYSKTIFLQITSQYIEQKKFQIFQYVDRIPTNYVRINNEQRMVKKNLKFILELIEFYETEDGRENGREDGNGRKKSFLGERNVVIYCGVVTQFCGSLLRQAAVDVYKQVRLKKKQFSCGLYAYLVFSLFLCAKHSLNQSQQLHQITTTTLCLQYMPVLLHLKSKHELLKLPKNLVPFKSKRKAFICRRLQIRSTLDQNKKIAFMMELNSCKSKMERRERARRNLDVVLGKFGEKVGRFYGL